jgi:hypothetical protein
MKSEQRKKQCAKKMRAAQLSDPRYRCY